MRVAEVAIGKKHRFFAEKSAGDRCHVREQIEELRDTQLALYDKTWALLNSVADSGYAYLDKKVCEQLGDGVFELKVRGNPPVRLFCLPAPQSSDIILIHSVWPKGNKKEQQKKIAAAKLCLRHLQNKTITIEFDNSGSKRDGKDMA